MYQQQPQQQLQQQQQPQHMQQQQQQQQQQHMPQQPVILNDNIVRSLRSGRVFKDNQARINSIDFHRTNDVMATAGDDDSIHVYNLTTGSLLETYYSRKYGVACLCYTHHPDNVLYASTKGNDHALRYHDLHDNKYVRYWRGHSARVNSLCMSPKTDMFISAGQDKEVRLWDLRTNICQGLLQVPGTPSATFDQQGLVFAVSTESGMIKLYDVRSYDKGPFDTFTISEEANSSAAFSDVRFSNDGKLMLATVESKLYVLDAYTGAVLHRFSTGVPDGGPTPEAAFSADNQYVLSGCEDRHVRVWSIASGLEVATLTPAHSGLPLRLKWAPRRLMLVSACTALVLWIPDMKLW